jgi:S1-C subfamily serine protease
MRSRFLIAIVLVWMPVLLGFPRPASASPAQSSVWIEVSRDPDAVFKGYRLPHEAEGMGVVVLAREIVTAAHVVWAAKSITVVDTQGTKRAARVARIDRDADLALLRVETSLEFPATIRAQPATTGEPVVAVQWQRPNGTATIATGTVWAPRWTSNGVSVPTTLTGIKGEKGMSGGGLFDESGQLVGIVIRIDRTLGYLSTLPVGELCVRFARCTHAAGRMPRNRAIAAQ